MGAKKEEKPNFIVKLEQMAYEDPTVLAIYRMYVQREIGYEDMMEKLVIALYDGKMECYKALYRHHVYSMIPAGVILDDTK